MDTALATAARPVRRPADGTMPLPHACRRWSLFFIVHIVMVVLANPVNELRSMITGYYKSGHAPEPDSSEGKH